MRTDVTTAARSGLALLFVAGLAACGDDDGGNSNDNQNQQPPVCGNGIVELGELCDFGAQNSDVEPDACRTDCRTAHCGDGVIDTFEVCDGSNLDGQACTDLGQGFTGGYLRCAPNCQLDPSDCATCPNGRREPGEACDGDELAGEDCVSLTGQQDGRVRCTDQCAFDTSACHTCGDGEVSGGEECEGDDLGGQTCVSLGYAYGQLRCDDTCHLDRLGCHGQCGNGNAEPDEACDGADFDGETCQSLGFTSGQLVCKPWCLLTVEGCSSCGDGIRAGDEECDGADLGMQSCATLSNGATAGTLACSGKCRFDTAGCTPLGTCGNGVLDPGEPCDGAELGGRTCASVAPGRYHGGALGCSAACLLDTDGCEKAPHCGNGFQEKDYGEQCDGLDLGGESCTTLGFASGDLACRVDCGFDVTHCYAGGACGNGVREGAEVCDGNDLGGATCASAGYATGPVSCLLNCTLDTSQCSTCGDGVRTGDDACDGADLGGETCQSRGFHGGTLGCNLDCSFDVSGCATAGWCGDGVLQVAAGEQCDGAQLGGDSCQTHGYGGGTLGCDTDCHVSTAGCWTCGDGICNYAAGEDYAACPADCAATEAITAGYYFTCALKADGRVWCWGDDQYGQLGDGLGGPGVYSVTPVLVSGLDDVVHVSAGVFHACAVRRDGTVWCWGLNTNGAIGDTSLQPRPFPVQVAFLGNVASAWAGYERTCAVDRDGDLYCWGLNTSFQLGDATVQNRLVPAFIAPGFVKAAPQGLTVTCGLRTDATVACWGTESVYGELGNGTAGASVPTPADAFAGVTDVVDVDVATYYSVCALRSTGELLCAGYNAQGHFGTGDFTSSSTPVVATTAPGPIAGFSLFDDLGGNSTVHAILQSGSLWAWGYGSSGAMGDAACSATSPTALPVAGLISDVVEVTGQYRTGCARLADGEIRCWGYSYYGETGQPPGTQSCSPVTVTFP